MASSRVHNKATAWCRPTMMATPQVTLMKATIGDRALEVASTALSRVVCTAARVTKGTTTHPTRTQSTCTETMKRTMICGNVPFMTVFGVFTFSPPHASAALPALYCFASGLICFYFRAWQLVRFHGVGDFPALTI